MATSPGRARKLALKVFGAPLIGEAAFSLFEQYKYWNQGRSGSLWLSQGGSDSKGARGISARHEITLKCNLHCYFCYQGDYREESGRLDELPFEDVMGIYERMGLKSIGLVGSEVFMYKKMYEVLEALDKKGVDIYLLTNGTLFNEQAYDRLFRLKHVRRIIYSIDGPAEAHNKVRGNPKAFQKTEEAVLRTMKHFPVGTNTVVLKENLKILPSLLEIGKSWGLTDWTFTFETRYRKRDFDETYGLVQKEMGWKQGADFTINELVREEPGYAFEELEEAVEETVRAGLRLGIKANFTPFIWRKNLRTYYEGTSREQMTLLCPKLVNREVTIDHLGGVHHCGVYRHSFGNLRERSMEEIWESPDYVRFRRLLGKQNLLPACARCCKMQFASGPR